MISNIRKSVVFFFSRLLEERAFYGVYFCCAANLIHSIVKAYNIFKSRLMIYVLMIFGFGIRSLTTNDELSFWCIRLFFFVLVFEYLLLVVRRFCLQWLFSSEHLTRCNFLFDQAKSTIAYRLFTDLILVKLRSFFFFFLITLWFIHRKRLFFFCILFYFIFIF